MVKEIKQKDFKKFDVLVLQNKSILDIFKTIVFVDKIEDELQIIQYL